MVGKIGPGFRGISGWVRKGKLKRSAGETVGQVWTGNRGRGETTGSASREFDGRWSRREIGNGKEEAGGWKEAGDGLMGRAERHGEDGRRWRGLEWMIGGAGGENGSGDGGENAEEMQQGAAQTVDGGGEGGGTVVRRRRRRPVAAAAAAA